MNTESAVLATIGYVEMFKKAPKWEIEQQLDTHLLNCLHEHKLKRLKFYVVYDKELVQRAKTMAADNLHVHYGYALLKQNTQNDMSKWSRHFLDLVYVNATYEYEDSLVRESGLRWNNRAERYDRA